MPRKTATPKPPKAPESSVDPHVAASPPDAQVDLTVPGASSSPALPHERDQSVGSTGGVPSPRVAQGATDVARGVRDTTRGTEADAAYAKLKRRP